MNEAANHGADPVLIDNFDTVTGGFTLGRVGGGKTGKRWIGWRFYLNHQRRKRRIFKSHFD